MYSVASTCARVLASYLEFDVRCNMNRTPHATYSSFYIMMHILTNGYGQSLIYGAHFMTD